MYVFITSFWGTDNCVNFSISARFTSLLKREVFYLYPSPASCLFVIHILGQCEEK